MSSGLPAHGQGLRCTTLMPRACAAAWRGDATVAPAASTLPPSSSAARRDSFTLGAATVFLEFALLIALPFPSATPMLATGHAR